MKAGFIDTDMQGDVLAVHRGDTNRDEILRYPKKTDVDGWREASRDEEERDEEEMNTSRTSSEERASISRLEVGYDKEDQGHVIEERNGERSPVREEERDMLSKCENGDELNKSTKNGSSSPEVDAMEDGYDSLKASNGTQVDRCLSESVEKEDEQGVLERDQKVRGFESRDNEESGSGSPGRDDIEDGTNTLSTEVANSQAKADELHHLKLGGTEEDIGMCNDRCENRDENRVLENDGEDSSSLMLREKDDEPQSPSCEGQVNDTSVRKMEMSEVIGEQDSPSCIPDAAKAAGETFQNVYFSGPVLPQSPSLGHRRTQSEMVTPGHRRTNSFQRLKTQMQKAWRGVSNLREDNRPTFNPEVLANQKRQWYQLHSSKALVFKLSNQTLETSFWLRSSSSPQSSQNFWSCIAYYLTNVFHLINTLGPNKI